MRMGLRSAGRAGAAGRPGSRAQPVFQGRGELRDQPPPDPTWPPTGPAHHHPPVPPTRTTPGPAPAQPPEAIRNER